MVIHSQTKKEEMAPSDSSSPKMSSPKTVAKSQTAQKQPLHNFRFPADLKWGMNPSNTNSVRKSPQNDTVSDKHEPKQTHDIQKSQSPRMKTGDGVEKLAKMKPTGDDVKEKSVNKPAADVGATSDGSRQKLIIRLKTKKSNKVADEVANAMNPNSAAPDDDYSDDLPLNKTLKIWPRKLFKEIKNKNNNNVNEGGALKVGGGAEPEMKAPEEKEGEKAKGKDIAKGKETEIDKEREKEIDKEKEIEKVKAKKEKINFSISLTQEEIEDDLYALTGARPSRKLKKRAKNVQKQLDRVFPGLWLASITPDSYKVTDGSRKLKG